MNPSNAINFVRRYPTRTYAALIVVALWVALFLGALTLLTTRNMSNRIDVWTDPLSQSNFPCPEDHGLMFVPGEHEQTRCVFVPGTVHHELTADYQDQAND